MTKIMNGFLNGITMYRLMLYFLLFLVVYSAGLSFLGFLPYNGFDILISSFYLVAICRFSNELLAKLFRAPTNIESSLITGFILGLIFEPVSFFSNIIPLTLVAIFAMASKYVLAIKGRHIFNPAAFGVVAGAVILHQGASWWIGNLETLPIILIGGLLILKKIRRLQLIGVFLLSSLIGSFLVNRSYSLEGLYPLIFFATVMLIEPLTFPYKFYYQIIFVILVVLLFNFYGRIISIPLEVSLLTGNIFAYIVNGSFRQVLKLKEKIIQSKDVVSFLFEPKLKFEAGQYLEWTLPHLKPDSRGVRRYFTISSSPTENLIMLSTKFSEKSSTFKTALQEMKTGYTISVSNLQGDFTLPKDSDKKLIFIAGGIGITPFRCMTKYLMDNGEKRDIILLFSNNTKQDIVFKDLFDGAKKIGLRTVYINVDTDGFINEKLIKKEVSDWKERYFYISGPEPMVEAFEKMLRNMDIPKSQIKTDFFPGYV